MLYNRKSYLDKLIMVKDTDFIKVITEVRRSGKSILLKLYDHYLLNFTSLKKTIYIAFSGKYFKSEEFPLKKLNYGYEKNLVTNDTIVVNVDDGIKHILLKDCLCNF